MTASSQRGPSSSPQRKPGAARRAAPPSTDRTTVPWILLVEDNQDLAKLATHALGSAAPEARVSRAADGKQAVAALEEAIARPDARRPDLVLLDLKLPGMDGIGVLEHMRADPDLQEVPVVVLSSCRSREDVQQAYQAGANSYVVKPVEFTELQEVIQSIVAYWLTTNLAAGADEA